MTLTIEGKRIGKGEKCFLIAELSANHDRDLDQALRLVDIAADAGWDCVKFQTYDADSLTVPSTHAAMRIDPVWGTDNLYDLYDTAGMPMEFHAPLFARARERGLLPFTSIYDPRDLDFVESLGCAIYKIASFEMTFDDLLIAVAGTKKPIVMSTGMADLREVEHALNVLEAAGSGPVVLLHCVSSYPTPPEAANLLAMQTLEETFGRPVGFSDHTIGSTVPLAAAALGAVAIEKHFTDDISRPGPDHRFSATPDILRDIAGGVDTIHAARGDGQKVTATAESGNRSAFRRSAFALRDLAEGEILTAADYRFVRPNAGVPVDDKAALQDRALARPVKRFDPITYDDLAPR
jgi:N-acetylneuraminate synthase